MLTTRTAFGLILTAPLYLASMLFIRHPFTLSWEAAVVSLFADTINDK